MNRALGRILADLLDVDEERDALRLLRYGRQLAVGNASG